MGARIVRLKLFGGFEASVENDCLVDVKLKRARLLLAYLALAPTGRASREELMTLLWSEREDAQARQSLRQTIAVTRRAFLAVNLDVLQADAETVAINLGSLQTDVVAFSRLARNTEPADLEAAAALYTGDFLAHFQVRDACAEDWITVRRTELQTLLARCLGSLMSGYQRLEQHDDVERIAARILEFDAYDEEAHRALMTVHFARGQRSLAFRQLQRCRESLLRDLSVRPAAETEALIKRTVPEPITDFSTAGNGRVEVFSRKSVSPVRAVAQNALARGPSLIVTPFEVLGDGARAQLLAYGLVEDIAVNLSRFSGLFVVPPGPAVSLNLHPTDPVIVGTTLGVRYVLTGSVQAVDDRVRVASTLLDTENNRVIWGELYDRRLLDFIDVRDDLSRRIAVASSSSADLAEFDRIKSLDTRLLGAWELCALAQRRFLLFAPEQNAVARSLFTRALELDPSFARAKVGVAWTHCEAFSLGWSNDPKASLEKANDLCRDALQSDHRLYSARYLLSYVHFYRRQFGDAIENCARARTDNPNDAEVLLHEGQLEACTGGAESGVRRVEEALSLNPIHPNWFHYIHSIVAFEAERFETSVVAAKRYIELQPGPLVGLKASALRTRAAANALSGHVRAAKQDAAEYLTVNPGFQVSAYVRGMLRQDPISFERMTTALRSAGLPG